MVQRRNTDSTPAVMSGNYIRNKIIQVLMQNIVLPKSAIGTGWATGSVFGPVLDQMVAEGDVIALARGRGTQYFLPRHRPFVQMAIAASESVAGLGDDEEQELVQMAMHFLHAETGEENLEPA